MHYAVPREVSGLDRSWFQGILSSEWPGVEIERVRLVEDIPGTSSKLRFELDYAPGAAAGLPRRMLVKGGFADHSDMFLAMHLTEMRYYRDIAPTAAFDTPDCYAVAEDPATGRSAVLIEDLAERQVRWLNALEPLGWDEVAAFLDGLADFAAQHWGTAAFAPGAPLDWVVDSYSGEAREYIKHYLEPARWDAFLHLPRCAALPTRLRDQGRMARALDGLAGRLTVQPMTLSHGDTHLGNLYINQDGRPGFLDAQPRKAPWVKDFAYHLVAALDIEDRREFERPLLARYLRRLAERGAAGLPTFEEAWADYRAELAYGLFIFMINESHFQKEEVNTAYAARFAAAVLDHDAWPR